MGDRPVATVRVAGVEQRDLRMIGLVLRHCDYNRFAYELADDERGGERGGEQAREADLILANPYVPEGAGALARLDELGHDSERIEIVPRGGVAATSDALALDRLAAQLLPVLNRVFERRLATRGLQDRGAAAAELEAGATASETEEATATTETEDATASTDSEFASAATEIDFASAATDDDATAATDDEAATAATEIDEAQTPRVLVVDDSPTVRRQLGVALERLGLAHEGVGSAALALERLGQEHFDLVLVDVMMPGTDGYKLTREIRRDRRLRQLAVIILTSRSSPFDLARGALAGCDAYLTKPVPFRALESAVRKQLRRAPRGAAARGPSRDAAPDDSTPAQGPAASRFARLFGR